jgi:hypothetical protein
MSPIYITELEEFYPMENLISTDGKGRITLGAEVKTQQFRVLKNALGQILLDPVVSIPEHEVWLWQNQEALQSLQKGLQEASEGKIHDGESFADCAQLDDDSEE